jgi:hypothetical protein
MTLVKMDPEMIGLLITIASTVLDLLFGRGHHIMDQALIQNLKTMYGYGLEGYGYAGEGFRYPPIEGYYDEPIKIAKIQKGPRSGHEIKRYLPKVDDPWVAAYLLNKRIAAKNEWREFAKRALKQASDEYPEHLKRNKPEAYARAVEEKQKRAARKGLRLPLRSAEGKRLFEEMEKLKDEELLAGYYYGRKPG